MKARACTHLGDNVYDIAFLYLLLMNLLINVFNTPAGKSL